MTTATTVLILDNRDSAAHGLASWVQALGIQSRVVRTQDLTPADLESTRPGAVIVGPGSGRAESAARCREITQACFEQRIPNLGIGLGMHVQVHLMGGSSPVLSAPNFGLVVDISHNDSEIFRDVPQPLTVCLYQHLMADVSDIDGKVDIIAARGDTVMGIRHQETLSVGFDFHPHSMMTQSGCRLLANWLRQAGLPASLETAARVDAKNAQLQRKSRLQYEFALEVTKHADGSVKAERGVDK